MTDKKKVPVSERALIARINRKLASAAYAGKLDANTTKAKLFKARSGTPAESDLGKYHVVDVIQNRVIHSKIEDLEQFSNDWGLDALTAWECSMQNLTDAELIDSGVTVFIDDIGLAGIDTTTEAGKKAFRAREKEIRKDIAYTEELVSRMTKLTKNKAG